MKGTLLLMLTAASCGGQTTDESRNDSHNPHDAGAAPGALGGDGGAAAGGSGGRSSPDGGGAAGSAGAGGGPAGVALSDCISIAERPEVTCDEICADAGRTCMPDCFPDLLAPVQTAHYPSERACQGEGGVNGYGIIDACGRPLFNPMLSSSTHVRCCCG